MVIGGKTEQMRNHVGFMNNYPSTHSHYCSKMVSYVELRDILQKVLTCSKNFGLYMTFDWLSVSFRKAVKLKDLFHG